MRGRIEAVTEMLVRSFGVTRILLFGSFARGEAEPGSDVDLLVRGLDAHRVIEATVVAARILGESDVDLVPVDLARPEIRERAESEGVLLYGA